MRIDNALRKPNAGKRAYAVFAVCATTALALPAQTFTTLYSFCSQPNCTDGLSPQGGLVQAINGDFYGTTREGGTHSDDGESSGTIFKITPRGALTTLYDFCVQANCTDGSFPMAGLVQSTSGDLYGTTSNGGATGGGAVFKLSPGGTLTTLYSFNGTDGSTPFARLIEAGGDFYGTTSAGGAYGGSDAGGTVFKITPDGTLTTLYSFCPQGSGRCTDGARPEAGLVQAAGGDFYGTTPYGGARGQAGTVFKITPSGTLTTLYSFCSRSGCTDGAHPFTELVQATDGDFYGTTSNGGANCVSSGGCGTVFKITPSGTPTTLYQFCAQTDCADGEYPNGLVRATDGNFYGTTYAGGASGAGTIFKITPSGTLTTLYSFDGSGGSGGPQAALVQGANGDFYGTATYGSGTIFSLSVGLASFVEAHP